MKLSVVMAVRNGEPYVHEAIDSVLAQSMGEFEYLIVDDASTDRTREILSAYSARDSRIRLWRNDHQRGPTSSYNRALEQAQGRVIARQDADDVSMPERFAVQLAALDSAADAVLITGMVEVFGPRAGRSKRLIPPSWQPRLEWELLFTNAIGAGAQVMFPRVFQGTPILFPIEHRYAQDYGLWCRLVGMGRVICPPQVVYRYRQHESSVSTRQKPEQDECVARIRREYQAQYTGNEIAPDALDAAARFWASDGTRPLTHDIGKVVGVLDALRARFLDSIDGRYGASARATLQTQLDEALSERLGYWLFRSIRFGDAVSCGRLLSVATARRETVRISARAIARVADAVLEKFRQRDPAVTCFHL